MSNMIRTLCEMENCVNYKNGYCTQKNPEKYEDSCLNYEDLTKSFRSKVRFKKGILGIREE